MFYTVIAKPTKACNADCDYCSSPPEDDNSWTIEDFKLIFDRIAPQLSEGASWIWHGGEPMLLGPDFYQQAYEYAKRIKPDINFSMQTNILLFKKKRWAKIFTECFEGRVSTSFDPEAKLRTIKGNAAVYAKQFKKKLGEVLDLGIEPLVISVFNAENAHMMEEMYGWAATSRNRTFHLRFNYQYPAGRDFGNTDLLPPSVYGQQLIKIYERWIVDYPAFDVVPLSQMLQKAIGKNAEQCPWTNSCGGKFLSIEPNGDLYNCGDFADLGDERYRFGNVRSGTLNGTKSEIVLGFTRKPRAGKFGAELMEGPGIALMARRRFDLPMDCFSCRHYRECQGGCMRDSELYGRGLGGKFFYCDSWKMIFDRIKESILSGEASNLLAAMGHDVEECQAHVQSVN